MNRRPDYRGSRRCMAASQGRASIGTVTGVAGLVHEAWPGPTCCYVQ